MFHIWYEKLSDIFPQHKHVYGTICHALFTSKYQEFMLIMILQSSQQVLHAMLLAG